MKLYVSVGRGVLFAILCSIIALFIIGGNFTAANNKLKNGSTNALRVEFAQSIRCEIKPEVLEQKEIIIPAEFSDVYESYNSIQKKAGYDLSKYKGCPITIYTYSVLDYGFFTQEDNARLNLMVYNGRIVGGDISTVDLTGIMLPLVREEEIYGKTAS